ncbi:MAG: hypothetical protein Q4D65_01155 [Peptostreptococcaceae bacterium]|nr:hypothetical protein [Peptostreptococcaceae bacterium]
MFTFDFLKERYNLADSGEWDIAGKIDNYPFTARLNDQNELWMKIDGIPSMEDELEQAEFMESLVDGKCIHQVRYKRGCFLLMAHHDEVGMELVIAETIDKIIAYMKKNAYIQPYVEVQKDESGGVKTKKKKSIVKDGEIIENKTLATLGAIIGMFLGIGLTAFITLLIPLNFRFYAGCIFIALAMGWLPFIGYTVFGSGKVSGYGAIAIYGLSFFGLFLGKMLGWSAIVHTDVTMSHGMSYWQVFNRLPSIIFGGGIDMLAIYLWDFMLSFGCTGFIWVFGLPKAINYANIDDPEKKPKDLRYLKFKREDIWKDDI